MGFERAGSLMADVLCLRPQTDFTRVGVAPPERLTIAYMAPTDAAMPNTMKTARALVIPAVGAKLPLDLFTGSAIRLVQVTGAGVDRVDTSGLKALGIPVANVPGGSNDALAEYAVSCASVLLRRFTQSTAAIRNGDYAAIRARMLGEGVNGLEGLLVGIVGIGVIGRAVAARFRQAGARIAFYDPAPASASAAAALGAEALALDELLARADVVSLHVPLLRLDNGSHRCRAAGADEARRHPHSGVARRHRQRSLPSPRRSNPAAWAVLPSMSTPASRRRRTIPCSPFRRPPPSAPFSRRMSPA